MPPQGAAPTPAAGGMSASIQNASQPELFKGSSNQSSAPAGQRTADTLSAPASASAALPPLPPISLLALKGHVVVGTPHALVLVNTSMALRSGLEEVLLEQLAGRPHTCIGFWSGFYMG